MKQGLSKVDPIVADQLLHLTLFAVEDKRLCDAEQDYREFLCMRLALHVCDGIQAKTLSYEEAKKKFSGDDIMFLLDALEDKETMLEDYQQLEKKQLKSRMEKQRKKTCEQASVTIYKCLPRCIIKLALGISHMCSYAETFFYLEENDKDEEAGWVISRLQTSCHWEQCSSAISTYIGNVLNLRCRRCGKNIQRNSKTTKKCNACGLTKYCQGSCKADDLRDKLIGHQSSGECELLQEWKRIKFPSSQ